MNTATVFPRQRSVVLPFRPDIENLLGPSTAKRFEVKGKWWLALPHDLDVVRLLRNHGETVDSPIRHYYNWPGPAPFESQIITADMLSTSARAYVLSEMGVGKTRAVLYAYDFLRQMGVVQRMLIVAPLSTLVGVWMNEVFEVFPHLEPVAVWGDARKRRKLLAHNADIYVINHEGVAVVQQELLARKDINVIALDELAAYRNKQSRRWKSVMPIVRPAKFAWGLTGAPTPNEPTDAYGQVRLLTPERVSYSFKAFRELTMQQVSTFRWIPRANANDAVKAAMQPQVRFVRKECFDLPETTYSTRSVPMDPRAAAPYKKMLDDLSVLVQSKQVTAANEGVKLSKLLQISAGFVYDADGKAQYVGGAGRIREIFNLVEQSSNKVIVFAPFTFYVQLLFKALAKKFPAAMVHGGVPKVERDITFQLFQKSLEPRVIVAHPGCMSHGLTLTAADTIIWAAPITSLEIYEQANARITRAGQRHQTYIVNIESSAAERHVYSRLKRKAKVQGALLELFQQDTAQLEGDPSGHSRDGDQA
jgi:SNF2 family DNA or RNA helicase